MRYVDALYACAKFNEAAAALHQAVARDHTFKSIPEYKVRPTALLTQMHLPAGFVAAVLGKCWARQFTKGVI